MRLTRSLLFIVIFQRYIYKVYAKFQSWLFKQDSFDISHPRDPETFTSLKQKKIYRQIQKQLIFVI